MGCVGVVGVEGKSDTELGPNSSRERERKKKCNAGGKKTTGETRDGPSKP